MNKFYKFLLYLTWLIIADIGITASIDRWVNDEYTETKLFKRIPQTMFWNFQKSKS